MGGACSGSKGSQKERQASRADTAMSVCGRTPGCLHVGAADFLCVCTCRPAVTRPAPVGSVHADAT